jgi:hypothetical protein
MALLGISEAFGKYGATLRNVQWSVCAWAPDGALVVSLWAHHYRKGPANTVEYADRTERWSGPGKNEFQENVAKAFVERSPVRLIVVRTLYPERVQAGESANKIPKDFDAKTEQIGEVVEFDGNNYVFRFRRRADEGTTK